MRSHWLIRTARVTIAAALLGGTVLATVAAARPVPERPRQRRAFNLFAVTNAVLDVNRVYCGINNLGELCVDPTNSPVLGGGFWPKGLPDQYIFNSGLQLAGVVDTSGYPGAATFTWKGDTVGAYFFDARGTQVQGDAVTLVYNSLVGADAAAWPNGAVVRDTTIFASALIGRDNVSQQDLWTRAWDGNPALIAGRTHPMGILVEERGLAWNYPSGNEDIIYFLFTFYNISASNPAVYNNPTINPAVRSEIAAVGASFQSRNEAAFNVPIPDNGYVIRDLYAAFSMDPDVGDAAHNYATAILPFSMALAYKADFLEPGFKYPPNIFGAPFVDAPGFVGVKYLRAPSPLGLTMFSNTRNAATAFPDPLGVKQLYRYLSGRVGAGDNPCSFSNPVARRLCFLDQQDVDTRFFQSSGPFVLPPGEARTIVVAYVHAAPLDTVAAYIGAAGTSQLKPQTPFPGDSIFADPSKIRAIERAAGWRSQSDVNGNLSIDQAEVTTVPRSLLNKALVAQTVYDNKFLLPFAPQGPQFFLIPGDNQVTVVWQPSNTENIGDPYYAVANSPLKPDLTPNPLYDPNYRQYDVEGYRIYRGRTSGDLQLVAQFDYSGTEIIDYTGGFNYGNCAPELAVFDDCPVVFDTTPPNNTTSFPHALVGEVIQVPPGGRVQLANGSILVLQADTAVTGGASGKPALSDNGVTFAYVDRTVRSSFRYFYAVTAFDVNSVQSGFTSLESAPAAKPVTPRRPASNVTATALVTGVYGSGGQQLDPTASWPTIDTATGTFSGIIPPANDGALLLASAAVEALPPGDISVRVDGVTPGFAGGIFLSPSGQPNLRLSLIAGSDTIHRVVPLPEPAFSATSGTTAPYQVDQALVPYDSAAARRFGIQFTEDVRMPVTFTGMALPVVNSSGAIAVTSGRFGVGSAAARYLAHSRWFDASGNEPPDPTVRSVPDSAKHAGRLTGVGRIYAPQAYRSTAINLNFRGYSYAQTAWYPADFVVTWNADSTLTVRDSTHRTTLPFSATGGSGWGFVNVRSLIAAGVTGSTNPATDIADGTGAPNINFLTYQHAYGTRPACFDDWWVIPCANLEQKAQFEPLDFNSDGTADANGIGLMINGEYFMMEMSAIPAANTRWRLRAITGEMSATCTPAVGDAMTDCTAYTFTPANTRPSFAPGLTYKITVTQQYAVDTTTSGSLVNVHTVPDPYYVTNALEITPNSKVLKFVNLPSRAIVRIYSVSGVLVQVLYHNDQGGSGEETWNLRNRNSQVVASGVYFYHVEGPDGQTKVGRFTVVNFAQ